MNLFEGFGNWLRNIGVDPKYASDQSLMLSNIVLEPEDGGQPVNYPGISIFRIIKSDPQQKWAIIQDQSFPKKGDPNAAQFPHAVVPSIHAGKRYIIRGDQFDKIVAPQTPAPGAM